MGLKSGEYGGRESRLAPAASIRARTRAPLWLDRLSRIIVFSHEAVREWEAKLTPALAEELRRRRRGQVGRSWYVDETYLKVHGRWCYLYRAIDRNGNLVDVLFSEHRDMAAARPNSTPATPISAPLPSMSATGCSMRAASRSSSP